MSLTHSDKPVERIILGIDPGTTIMGYGLIHARGNNVSLIVLGVIELRKFDDHYIKLKHIFERVTGLIDQYHPDELAIEAPFFGKNVQSMLKLGRAQGVAISAALSRSLPIFEYAPRKIKMSITGRGNASKEQVALLLKSLLKIKELPSDLDATDGLAAALCHFYQTNSPVGKNEFKSWKDFMNQNPGRIKK
ncbi:MAG: crossover junction endodeoxyribonuclease RuvC [Bacteroidetes bacterium GWC2_33_15]|nr:MAG: crossover junction endodeoxyribonuclease RuvC [Bacteroidetes bacterium GWA2_33_15]OFX52575.1 MAG: crossover junction endodeoxyribonuclease RuvC [Bacteroidetes bacterium GWC2_33_15]OFX63920.1 MAG: crossover junction endodeoxyribonuclease RuvC [Bacteroidetes bacterium GWB2_32_14]OFX70813.1 MAG: crossover junction endodeoxyribonuclease RuvC [Bacteroidetes bacterium GWD2_33_33]HAN19941.1 crossover junction endodeoxyribonuclease RuvC [Bacteroidales bacterium]